jgi:DNA-directed RNA polymerase subunit alpha
LKHAGIETVEELMNKEFEELLKIKKFGKKSVEEINEKLSEYNLVLTPNELHTNS